MWVGSRKAVGQGCDDNGDRCAVWRGAQGLLESGRYCTVLVVRIKQLGERWSHTASAARISQAPKPEPDYRR